MGIFSRNKQGSSSSGTRIVPIQTLDRLSEVGRLQFGNPPQFVDVSDFYLPGFLAAGSPTQGAAWDTFVDQFVVELSAAADRLGGWANAGAFYVAKDFVRGEDWNKRALVALMDRGLRFLVSAGVGAEMIPMFALPRFREMQGGGAEFRPALPPAHDPSRPRLLQVVGRPTDLTSGSAEGSRPNGTLLEEASATAASESAAARTRGRDA